MKLSELKPCPLCGGKISPVFYTVKVQQMMLDTRAANQVLGLTQIFGGALGLAEAMAPVDDVTIKLQEEETAVCQDCFLGSGLAGVLFAEARAVSDVEVEG